MKQISNEQISSIKNIFDSYKDKEFMLIVNEFVEYQLGVLQEQELTKSKSHYFIKSLKIVLDLVSNHCIDSNDEKTIFSWKSFCGVMQKVNSLEDSSYLYKARKLLAELYKYVLKNITVNNKYINELKEYSYLLEIEEKTTSARSTIEWPNFVYQQIHTHFPKNSEPKELYLYEYPSPNSADEDKNIKSVLHFKKTNSFIREVLIEFVESLPKGRGVAIKPSKIQYRQFLYFFGVSLYSVQKEPDSIHFFTFETFRKQYRFYKTIEERFPLLAKPRQKEKREVSHSLISILKEFYLFLLQKIKEDNIDHNPFSGTAINGRLLMINAFNTYYEEGFTFVFKNGFENLPNRNRWAIITDGNNATSSKNLIHVFDFTEIKDKRFLDDVRNFIWFEHNISTKHLRNEYRCIKDFLNFKYSFDLQNKNVINIGYEQALFSEELMLFYRSVTARIK